MIKLSTNQIGNGLTLTKKTEHYNQQKPKIDKTPKVAKVPKNGQKWKSPLPQNKQATKMAKASTFVSDERGQTHEQK